MKKLWIIIKMFVWMTLLTGFIYPLLITGIAQLTMKQKADGNFIFVNEKIIGATLIAQKFESDRYFWGRPSAVDYNPLPSGGSNLGPTSKALKKLVEKRQETIAKAHQVSNDKVPTELLFASGSGIDPHISVSTAYFQINRIAASRGIDRQTIANLIDSLIITPAFGFLGGAYVNVLLLNHALDGLSKI